MKHPVLALLLSAVAVVAAAQDSDGLPERVKQSLERRVEDGDHPGFVLGIVDVDGERIFSYGTVSAERPEAPDGQTLFEIGSVSKVFTSILLADMVERGMLRLDDPVSAYLPDSVSMPGSDAVTLAHLATHTSGLPRLPANLQPADPSNPYADYTVADLYDFLNAHSLTRDPGDQYEYSNLASGLLGHVLSRQAGSTYEALVEERINEPLGLEQTGIVLDKEDRQRLAPGHRGGREVPGWDLPTLAGAGGLRSSAKDMLRFVAANLGFIESPLAAAMRRTHEARAAAGKMGDDSLKVGLGWHIRDSGDRRILWHNGGTGGYHSFIGFDPQAKRGVVLLTNSTGSADDVGFHLLDADIPLEEPRRTVQVSSDVLERYAGRYELAPTFHITITMEDGRLYGQETGQQEFALYAASETEFFLKVVDAEIIFHIDNGGAVTGLTLNQNGQSIPGRRIEPAVQR